jgi:carbonic anhydrase
MRSRFASVSLGYGALSRCASGASVASGLRSGTASLLGTRFGASLALRGRFFSSKEEELMEQSYNDLVQGNRSWVAQQLEKDPDLFKRMSVGQNPQILWIGCSDSRVPANVITNSDPGSIFVHRNIANTVVHTDMNLLSVMQYAVDVLKVKHIIVCGHYGCGGVIASMTNNQFGMVDNWLRNLKDEYLLHRDELESIPNDADRARRMTELHVVEGVYNVCRTSIIKDAWEKRKGGLIFPHVHGWVYGVHDGFVRDLKVTVRGPDDVPLLVRKPVDPTKC